MKAKKIDVRVIAIISGKVDTPSFATGIFAGENTLDDTRRIQEANSLWFRLAAVPVDRKEEGFDLYDVNRRLRGHRRPLEGDTDTSKGRGAMEATE